MHADADAWARPVSMSSTIAVCKLHGCAREVTLTLMRCLRAAPTASLAASYGIPMVGACALLHSESVFARVLTRSPCNNCAVFTNTIPVWASVGFIASPVCIPVWAEDRVSILDAQHPTWYRYLYCRSNPIPQKRSDDIDFLLLSDGVSYVCDCTLLYAHTRPAREGYRCIHHCARAMKTWSMWPLGDPMVVVVLLLHLLLPMDAAITKPEGQGGATSIAARIGEARWQPQTDGYDLPSGYASRAICAAVSSCRAPGALGALTTDCSSTLMAGTCTAPLHAQLWRLPLQAAAARAMTC